MADSYRLTILKRLTVLLEGIVPTAIDGVALPSTLAGVVFRGRSVYGDKDPITMLSILEAPRPFGAVFSADDKNRKETWPLLLQGWCPDAKINPTDNVYSLLEDCEIRLQLVVQDDIGLPNSHYMLGDSLDGDGKLITSFQAGPPVVRPPTEGVSSKSCRYVPLQVGLARISR